MTLSVDPLGVVVLALVIVSVLVSAAALHTRVSRTTSTAGPTALAGVAVLATAIGVSVAANLGLLGGLGVAGSFGIAGVAGAVAGWAYLRRHREDWTAARSGLIETIRASTPTIVAFALLSGAQLAVAVLTLARVGDNGWDAATYHLPVIGSILQEGSLFGFPDLRAFIFYPALVETQATLLAIASGSMHIPSLVQVFYWIVGLWLVGSVVRHRANQSAGIAAMAVMAAIPTAWLQARTLHEDVAFAVVLLAAALMAISALRDRSPAAAAVGALLTGALFGMKLGAPAAIPVALLVGLASIRRESRRVLPVVVLLGVLGAFPYMVRNAVEFGLPFYPIDLSIPNEPVDSYPGFAPYSVNELRWFVDAAQRPERLAGAGVLDALTFQYVESPVRVFGARLGWDGGERSSRWARFDARLGGFGVAWLVLLGLGAAGATWRAVRGPRVDGVRWVAGSFTVLALVCLAVSQASWWPRFVIGVGLLMVVATASSIPSGRLWTAATWTVVALSVFMVFEAERSGGYFYWTRCDGGGCVATAEARALVKEGLSGRTLAYEPLISLDPEAVVVVGPDPNVGHPYFPVSLWAPDWRRRVENLVIGSPAQPGSCREAYVAQPSSEGWLRGWLEEADPDGEFEWTPWSDPGGDRFWVLRRDPCAAS
jgi:hypothetical protein